MDLILDWLGREGGGLLSWWLIATVAGIASYPLLFRLLAPLPSRGYAQARAAGILLIGFIFWLCNTLGLMRNNTGGILLATLIVIGFSAASIRKANDGHSPTLRDHLRAHRGLVFVTELLFIGLFFAWCLYRAYTPDLVGTEKPMEMAFLNAVRGASAFPPPDPWFSGYAISYYHFGYILMGSIANLSGVTSGIAFNQSIALIFALAGIGILGLVYDLVLARRADSETMPSRAIKAAKPGNALAAGLLGVFMLIMMGNAGMVMSELPYQSGAMSQDYLAALNLLHRPSDFSRCAPSGSLNPADWCYYWWWAYSRVVQDTSLAGGGLEVITEFPQFSFLLADIHPHVLALPFALLVLTLGLGLVMGKRPAHNWEMLLYGIFVGGMVFLNSWDAIYLVVFTGIEGLRRLLANGTGKFQRSDWLGIFGFALRLTVLTGVLYITFFIGFRTQAGGPLPNVIWPTSLIQYVMMFAPFIVLFVAYLQAERGRAGASFNNGFALQVVGTLVVIMFLLILMLAIAAWVSEDIRSIAYQVFDQSGGVLQAVGDALLRRLNGLPLLALLLGALYLLVGRLFPKEPMARDGVPARADVVVTYSASTGFALLLIGAGVVLTLAPEFFYLRDGFGYRINTIFKLYYQTWIMWSVAGAYVAWSLFSESAMGAPKPSQRLLATALIAAIIGSGSLYPWFAIQSRAVYETGRANDPERALSMDGGESLAAGRDDYLAIMCLARIANSDVDVVAEATKRGLAYNKDFGRVSALSGIPTLLGWDNHQGQWRGATFAAANTLQFTDSNGLPQSETRYDAIERLYNSLSLQEAAAIVGRYGITYIYVGPTERLQFSGEGLSKFESLPVVCRAGGAVVYAAGGLNP
jgi:YYY domain-containing protein